MNQSNIYLSCLLSIAFISFLGIALPYPIMAPLFLSKTNTLTFINIAPEVLYGIALAGYPLGQFCGSPILGVISDHWGRKTTLSISLIMTCFGYLLSIYALAKLSFLLFAISRLFTGFWEGILPITRAAAADLQGSIPKTRSFGYINAAATSGFLFGPIIGGLLVDNSYSQVFRPEVIFWFALFITILALLVLLVFYKDSSDLKTDHEIGNTSIDILKKIKSTWAPFFQKEYFYLILMSTFITLGFDICYQFYPLYLVSKWQLGAYEIAVATVVLSISMILTQVFLIKILNNKFRVELNIAVSGISYAALIITMVFIGSYYNALVVFLILGLFIGVIGTNLPVFVSDMTPQNIQGQIMGLMMSLRFLGDGVMCLVGGALASTSIVAPFILASIFVFIGTSMFMRLGSRKLLVA